MAMSATIKSVGASIGWAMLHRALSWLIASPIMTMIKESVAILMDEDLSNEVKHAQAKDAARAIEEELTKGASKLPGSLLDIAIKASYLEMRAKSL